MAAVVPAAIQGSDATDKFKNTLRFADVDPSRIEELTAAAQKYADQTVYDLSDIQSVTAQLAANGVKDFDKMAEAAGNVNAISGGTKETFKQVALALVQINGAGKLATQDWNQIAAAIPGASGKLQEAMKANGAYTGNFRDAMAKGEITAEEFNQALMDLGFTDVAIEAAKTATTFEGAWGNFQAALEKGVTQNLNRIKEPLTSIINSLGDQLGPAFDSAGRYADALAKKLKPIADGLAGGSLTLEDIGRAAAAAAGGFAALAGAGSLLSNPQAILGFFDAIPDIPPVTEGLSKLGPAVKTRLGEVPAAVEEARAQWGERLDGLGRLVRERASLLGDAFDGAPKRAAVSLAMYGDVVSARIKASAESVKGAVGQFAGTVGSRLQALGSGIADRLSVVTEPLAALGSRVAAPVRATASKAGEWVAPIGRAFDGLGGRVAGALGQVGPRGAKALQAAAGPLSSAAEGLLGQVGMFLNPARFGKVLAFGSIAAVAVAGLGAVIQASGGEVLTQIQGFISNAILKIAEIGPQLVSAAPQLIATGAEAVKTVIKGITQVAPVLFADAGLLVSGLVSALGSWLPQLVPAGVEMVMTIIEGLVGMLPGLISAGADLIRGLASGIADSIPVVTAALPQVLTALVGALAAGAPQLIDAGTGMLLGLINGLVAALPTLTAAVPQIIGAVVTTIVTALPQLIDAGTQVLQALIGGLVQAIPQLVGMLPQIITTIVTTLVQNIPKVLGAGAQILKGLVSGISDALPQLWELVKSIPGKLLGFLAGIPGQMVESGKKIIGGLIDGIGSMVSSAVDAVGGVLGAIRDWLPFSPAKKGPFSGRGWTLYSGQSIVEALAQGARQSAPSFEAAVADAMAAGRDQIDDLESGALRFHASLGGASGLAGLQVEGPKYVVVRDADDALVGRMRVEASGEVGRALAPASRAALRQTIGF
nr:MAG TPA: tail tape measure [Caudoviricetes sp.]